MPKNTFSVQWHLTEKCNLRCKHCYQNLKYLKQEIPLEKKIDLIEDLHEFSNKLDKNLRISFTGGEPFVVWGELKKLLEICNNHYKNIKINILSNGVFLDKEKLSFLKNIKNLEYIQISLEGLKEVNDFIRGKGVFDKAIDSIKNLKENGINVAVMCTLSKTNKEDILPLIGLCEELNVDYFGMDRLVPEGEGGQLKDYLLSSDEIKNLYAKIARKQKKLNKKGGKINIVMKRPLWCLIKEENEEEFKDLDIGGACAAGYIGIALMPNGDVMPCRRMDMIIGNILKQDLIDIWYGSDVLWNLRERRGECSNCEFKTKCYGCRAIAKAMSGDYLSKDPQCWK